MDKPVIIEGQYAAKGERQPVIKSWQGLGAFFALILLRVLWELAVRH
jgi:hypothetical protein